MNQWKCLIAAALVVNSIPAIAANFTVTVPSDPQSSEDVRQAQAQKQTKPEQLSPKYAPPKGWRQYDLVTELQGILFDRNLAEIIAKNIKKNPDGECDLLVQAAIKHQDEGSGRGIPNKYIKTLRDRPVACGPYPESPPPPDNRVARAYYAGLITKYRNRIHYESAQGQLIVENFNMDCRYHGRYVPLMHILVGTIASTEEMGIKRDTYVTNRGDNVRITEVDTFKDGNTARKVSFTINEWGEIKAFGIPRGALAATCVNDSDPGKELFIDP